MSIRKFFNKDRNYFRKSGDFIAEFADFRRSPLCPDMPQLPLSGGGYRRDRCYGGVAGFCKIKHPLCRWACGCCMGGGFGRVPNPRLLQLFEDLVNEFSYVAHIDGAVAVDVAIFVVFGGENHVHQSSYVAHIHDAIAVHVAEQRRFIFCF